MRQLDLYPALSTGTAVKADVIQAGALGGGLMTATGHGFTGGRTGGDDRGLIDGNADPLTTGLHAIGYGGVEIDHDPGSPFRRQGGHTLHWTNVDGHVLAR